MDSRPISFSDGLLLLILAFYFAGSDRVTFGTVALVFLLVLLSSLAKRLFGPVLELIGQALASLYLQRLELKRKPKQARG